MSFSEDQSVVLFDGVCGLCNGAVDFILSHDKAGYFVFAALQSKKGQEVLAKHGLPQDEFDSFLLLEHGRLYEKSTAALRVAHGLGYPWRLAYVFKLVPRFLRDAVYGLVAKNRYRWFGKKEACRMPTPEERKRFLL